MKLVLMMLCLLSTESYSPIVNTRASRLIQPLYSTSSNYGTPGTIMTLSRFMIEATRSNPDHADFESLMASIQIACKTIAHLVSRAGISDLTGLQASSKGPKIGTSSTNRLSNSDVLNFLAYF